MNLIEKRLSDEALLLVIVDLKSGSEYLPRGSLVFRQQRVNGTDGSFDCVGFLCPLSRSASNEWLCSGGTLIDAHASHEDGAFY